MGKIYFDEKGGTTKKKPVDDVKTNHENKKPFKSKKFGSSTYTKTNGHQLGNSNISDIQNLEKKWFEIYPNHNTFEDIKELKDSEQQEISKKCHSCFEHESEAAKKLNPSDSKWLETALHQGTARDRANAGALLVQTNPLSNLTALETLISQTKVSNKSSPEVIEVLSELFMTSLIPKDRKLMSLLHRGNDWKKVRTDASIQEAEKNRILAYWYFEEQLRDHYYEFLKHIQEQLKSGNDKTKSICIRVGSLLLAHGPEKEAFLLTIVVNKLGDPLPKIASTASYRLTEVLYKHPNMVEVMVIETEKLLFRSNITETAQHFALSFLACLSRFITISAADRLLKICFAYFKIKIQKGDINSKMMKLILLCLRRALEVKGPHGGGEDCINNETLTIMYRLVHLSNIEIGLQTLSVLLEVVLYQDKGNHERFYNALYKKIHDKQLGTSSLRVANLFFHIFHRAVQNDRNVERAQAFMKRLLQAALNFPSSHLVGALVVVNKILKARAPLLKDGIPVALTEESNGQENKMKNFEDDDDDDEEGETYHDAPEQEEKSTATQKKSKKQQKASKAIGWVHTKTVEKSEEKPDIKQEKIPVEYDPHNRSAAFAGAQYTRKYELVLLLRHFHPSVQLITDQVVKRKPVTYYGDPLRDFSLTTFLDRFCFKNPKTDMKNPENHKRVMFKNKYKPQGSRGIPVHNLTKQNCTEEEKFIFEFLEKKREKKRFIDAKLKNGEEEDDHDDEDSVASEADSVDDDEFNDYLDSLGAVGATENDEDDEIDYMQELGQSGKQEKIGNKKNKKAKDDDIEGESDEEGHWDDVGNSEEELDEELELSDAGSVSLDENEMGDLGEDDDDDASVMTFSDEDDDEDFGGKKRKGMSDKEFTKKLKKSTAGSLFAAADDFADILDSAGTSSSKDHGTLGEVFNKDKSSQKQLSWEASRFKEKLFNGNKKRNQHGANNKMGHNKKGFTNKAHFKSGKVMKGNNKFKSGPKFNNKKQFKKRK